MADDTTKHCLLDSDNREKVVEIADAFTGGKTVKDWQCHGQVRMVHWKSDKAEYRTSERLQESIDDNRSCEAQQWKYNVEPLECLQNLVQLNLLLEHRLRIPKRAMRVIYCFANEHHQYYEPALGLAQIVYSY